MLRESKVYFLQFFLEESDDTTNTQSVRDMASDLFIRANDLTFHLYINFLHDTLPLLDDMNLKLQTPMYKPIAQSKVLEGHLLHLC